MSGKKNAASQKKQTKILAKPKAPQGGAGGGGKKKYETYTADSYLSAAAARGKAAIARDVVEYGKMLLDPISTSETVRYPDESLAPSATSHFTTATTYSATAPVFVTELQWKMVRNAVCTSGNQPTIRFPWVPGATVPGTDYGAPQTIYASLCAVDRTLAFGIRVSVVGLPPNTFMSAGTMYFLQIQSEELNAFRAALSTTGGEEACRQAVSSAKGFAVSINEISRMGGAQIPFLPQGPMSYVFSDVDAVAATNSTSGNIMSTNPCLVCVGFGLVIGTQFRIQYAHHVEYIPEYGAAGLVETEVCPPSTEAREAIARVSMTASSEINGSNSGAKVSSLANPTPSSLSKTLGSVVKGAVGLLPGGSILNTAASMAGGVAQSLGAPSWVTDILSS